MPDEFKKILQRELEELQQNKVRAIALGAAFVILLIVWIIDDNSSGEEINLDESITTVDVPTATKDLPVVNLPIEKSSDGVTLVLGANAEPLFIGDPFAGEEKSTPPPKIVQPPENPPVQPILIQPPPPTPLPKIIEQPKPQEKFILTGTAISGTNKTAMFLRGNETIFLTVGEEIGGKKISDITPDFVIFEDGERVFIQRELR